MVSNTDTLQLLKDFFTDKKYSPRTYIQSAFTVYFFKNVKNS